MQFRFREIVHIKRAVVPALFRNLTKTASGVDYVQKDVPYRLSIRLTLKRIPKSVFLVCVYGNRAYEDTLVEMEDAANHCGFQVVAAIAAVAEHSILSQYASNRPDASDEKQLVNFADQIADKDGCAV